MASGVPAERVPTNDEDEDFQPPAKRLRAEMEVASPSPRPVGQDRQQDQRLRTEAEPPSPRSVGQDRQDDKLKDFDLLEVLGEGRMTKVWHARKKQDQMEVAIKQVEKGRKRQKAVLRREVKALKRLSGQQFIVGVQQMLETPKHVYFVMDYAAGGDMMDLIRRQKKLKHQFTEKEIKFYISELVLALDTVHSKFIVHRDIKPDNVLLDRDGHVLLADFGICQLKDTPGELARVGWKCGTREYMAPEVLQPNWRVPGSECARDSYAVGVIALKMACGKNYLPYGDQMENGWAHMKWQQFQDHLLRGMETGLPNIPDTLPDRLHSLLTELLEVDCNKRLGRYGAHQLQDHYFFEDVNWDDVAAKRVAPPFPPETSDSDILSDSDESE